MSKPVSYRIVEDGRVLLSRPADLSVLRGPDKSVLDPDLQVKIDKQVWGVNRCVVRVCSRLIDGMMDTNMAEAKSNEIPFDPSYVPPDVFEQILDLLYDGWVLVMAGDMVDVLAVSNFLKYAELTQACLSFLQEHLDVNVLTKAWEYSNLYFEGATGLLEVCQQKIPGLFEEWSKMEDFCNLGFKELSAVMEIAELRNKNRDENKILEAIVGWLHFDWAGRCCYINRMLAKVQWRKVNSGKAIECELVRKISQTKMRSVEEREAMILLLRAIGMGPDGDFEGLFGVKVSEPVPSQSRVKPKRDHSKIQNAHVAAGIKSRGDCEIVLSTIDNNTHNVVKEEPVEIPPAMRAKDMTLWNICSFDSHLYILVQVRSESVYVLYEYDHKSEVVQYAVLRTPSGRAVFHPFAFTRLFLDEARVVIANGDIGHNGIAAYYMARDELVFSQNPLVNMDDIASCQLLAANAPVPDYARELSFSALAFDDLASRLYFCCGCFSYSNLVFYLDLQSNGFVRCPDFPLELCAGAATVHEGSLLVAGGLINKSGLSSKVWRLDKDGSNWVELPSMSVGHPYGSLLVKDGRLYHFDTGDERVGLETLDLMNPQDGWKMNENSIGMFSSMGNVHAFLP